MVVNSPCNCWVLRDGDQALRATIIQQRAREYYVHYDGRDKRLDEWVPTSIVQLIPDSTTQTDDLDPDTTRAKKRNRTTGPNLARSDGTPATADDESNSPLPSALGPSLHTRDQTEAAQQHRALTAQRNFDRVNFGQWHIKTWYFSPYPSFDDETDTQTRPRATPEGPATAGHGGVSSGAHSSTNVGHLTVGATPAAHHTSAAAGTTGSGDATLWVCDRCFEYMREATHWELHKTCKGVHPPGREVYQRGAHTIWEADGQAERFYCQNLLLIGKLFIDVKTSLFDTEHCEFASQTGYQACRWSSRVLVSALTCGATPENLVFRAVSALILASVATGLLRSHVLHTHRRRGFVNAGTCTPKSQKPTRTPFPARRSFAPMSNRSIIRDEAPPQSLSRTLHRIRLPSWTLLVKFPIIWVGLDSGIVRCGVP